MSGNARYNWRHFSAEECAKWNALDSGYPEMEPCFFCGSTKLYRGGYPVQCRECGVHGPKPEGLEIKDAQRQIKNPNKAAILLWNRMSGTNRAAPAPQAPSVPQGDGIDYIRAFRDLVVARVQRTGQSFHSAMEDEWILALEVTPDPIPEPEQETYYLSEPIPDSGRLKSWDCVYCGKPKAEHGTDMRCPKRGSTNNP